MTEEFIADPELDAIPYKPLRDILEIWQNISKEHGYAERKHFTPQLLKDHLPYLVLMDYERDSGRFKVRLIGTRYSEAIGFESTGMYVDELPYAQTMQDRFKWLVDHKKPYYAHLDKMEWAGQEFRHYAVIGCPLYGKDKEVNMILFRVNLVRMGGGAPVSSF